jgi:hypothetical protein
MGAAVNSGMQAEPTRIISIGKVYNSLDIHYRMSAEDVATAPWHKSSWSSYNGSCVEVAELPDSMVLMRDTKAKEASPILAFTHSEWNSFLASVRKGELDF